MPAACRWLSSTSRILGGPADRVQCDFDAGGRLAFRYLRDLGCSRPGLVMPERGSFTVSGRGDAFLDQAALEKVSVEVFREGRQTYEAGRIAAGAVAARAARLDGIFCVGDYMALGLLDGLRQDHGLAVPGDLRLIGFDDISQAAWGAYDLTTIRQSRQKLSALAVELLADRIDHPDRKPRLEVMDVELVVRST